MKPHCLYTKILASFLVMLLLCAAGTAVLFHVIFQRMVEAHRFRLLEEAPQHEESLPRLSGGKLIFDLPLVSRTYGLEYAIFNADEDLILTDGKLCDDEESMKDCLADEHVYVVPVILEDMDEIGLFAATEDPLKESQQKKLFFIGLGTICGIASLWSLLLARRLSSPLTRLKDAVSTFASGSLSTRVRPGGPEEIKKLSETFNAMADSLEQKIQGSKELTANVSHELRSPLTRIRLIQELFSERVEPGCCPRARKLLDDMKDEIESMDLLIGKILRLSKLDTMDSFSSTEEIDLCALVQQALKSHSREMRIKGLTTRLRMPPTCIRSGNKESLHWMVNNVFSNAVKFSPENDTIRISLEEDQGRVLLQVENTASYPDDVSFEQACQPFHRLGPSDKPGYGLGLAIACRAAERHGGKLVVTRGSQGFLVTITI